VFLSRRELLSVGVLVGAAFFLPAQPLFAASARDRLPESRLPRSFADPAGPGPGADRSDDRLLPDDDA
jgi:hypothetical protein